MQSRYVRTIGAGLVGLTLAAGLPGPAHAGVSPRHLTWAERLVDTITPADNEYGAPAEITWVGTNGLDHSTNRTKCGSLVSQLLARAYGLDYIGWLGCTSPIAMTYHDAIEVEDGFALIEGIAAVRPGDIIAISYLNAGCTAVTCGTFKTCGSSGHVALVAALPTLRTATAPIVPGTLQFEVEIIDSSSDVHGVTDSRYQSDILGADDTGVGRGTMRLYVDRLDKARPIVGYTWSTWSGSKFYAPAQRDLVIGRIHP